MAASQPQHMTALDRANEIRKKQAALKRAVAEGRQSLADVIDPQVETDWDQVAEGIRVEQLLRSPHRMGHDRAWKLLFELRQYRQGLRLREMGQISRGQLATILRERKIGEPA